MKQNTEFTPAPWFTEVEGNRAMSWVFANGVPICYDIYNEANANLIAAAPDMYEALKEMIDVCNRDPFIAQDITIALIKAKAVLNKANP